MNKKIGIVMAALMMAALVMPAVMAADVTYTASVLGGQNTAITSSDGAFGSIIQGNSKSIASSVVLSNTGDATAVVTASSVGLTGPGTTMTNLVLTKDSTNYAVVPSVALANLVNGYTATYGATLTVPALQTAGSYSGTVALVFANI